jgi:NAD(P)-dependent dehydrogenase (short-subunit alcohol dehydrogenase family)
LLDLGEDWSGEVALVTGASGSIGAAIADRFEALGARVAGSDLAQTGVQSERRRYDSVDVTDEHAVGAWVSRVGSDWSPPTIAVICAGISRSGRLVDTSTSDWRAVLDVNLDGAFFVARAAIRSMLVAGKGGRVVFIGSWAAHAPHPHIGSYSVAKAGLRSLMQCLALEHAQDGILVNEVAPGIVDAGLSKTLFDADAALKARTMAAIPTGGLVTVTDVARDVAYLASPLNRQTTGTVIVTDGAIGLSSTMNPGRRS